MPPRVQKSSRRTTARAFAARALGAAVLAAYLLVLAGSPIGHGLRMAMHVASESHEAAPSVAVSAHEHGEETRGHEHHDARRREAEQRATHEADHAHGRAHHHHDAPEPKSHHHAAPEPAAPSQPRGTHAHGERAHTHAPPPASEALRVVLLDRHCLFAAPAVPIQYPTARTEFARAPVGLAESVGPVETPPPRDAA